MRIGEAEPEADERREPEADADEGERHEPGGDQAAPLRALDVEAGEPEQGRQQRDRGEHGEQRP